MIKVKVANFDPQRVKETHEKLHSLHPLKSLLDPKYFWHGWFGYTLDKVLAFLFLYYAILIFVTVAAPSYKDCKNENELSFCSIHNKEGSFCKSTKNWKLDHKNMVKVLGFLLGFYTATVMKRWWSQISHMPLITNVSMVLNGIVVPGEKGSMSAMILKKTLLRYCMLSWTILMGKISPIIKEKYTNTDALIVKGLVTTSEIKKLYKNDDDLVWWIPFEWSMLLINKEMNEKGHLPRQGKVVLYALKNFKQSLEEVMEYNHTPLPAICGQAVHVVCWFYLIISAFAAQPWCDNDTSFWYYFQRFPINYCVLVALMFGWLKMSEICASPFDGDDHYDIDVDQELELEIWRASLALQEAADDAESLSYRDLLQLSTTTEGQELSTPIKTELEKDDGTDISSPISIIYKLDEFKVHQAM